jgi:ABC-type transporter Mla subunit MlaD
MRREPNYLMLGATVAAIAVMFVGVLLFLAGAGGWGRSYQKIRVTFAHDMPLPKLLGGAEVTCGGMPVGKVKSVDLKALPRDDGKPGQDLYIVVDALVDEQVGLRRDCKIRAEGPPLGGGGTLVIVHRGLSSQPLPDGATVSGLAPAGLNAVVGTLGDKLAGELDDKNPEGLLHLIKSQLDAAAPASLMFKVNAIASDLVATSGQVRRQLDPEQQGALMAKLDATLADIKTLTGAMRNEADAQNPGALLARLHGILSALASASQNAAAMLQESRPTIQATLSNVQGTSGMIKDDLLPSLMTQVDPGQTGSLMSKFQAAADKTNAALDNISQLSGSAKNLLIVNQDPIDATVINLRETSEHLRAASREIRRNPWKLLYQPSKNEVRQESVADAARSFSDAAGSLDAAFARLEAYVRSAGASLPADDPQLKDMQEHLAVSLKNLTASEKRFWDLFLSPQR